MTRPQSLAALLVWYRGEVSDAIPKRIHSRDFANDGSHQWQHQVTTAATLLGLVAPGGVYVVEDLAIDCQPELVADRVTLPPGMAWRAIPCGFGLGEKARCHPACDRCGGTAGEQLLVFEWSNRL